MFERMEISGYIYEGVVEPFYENLLENMLTQMFITGK